MSGELLGIDELRSGFAHPPRTASPLMRWWWFGPSVSRPELQRELTAMADAGLGGVEVAYVYPLSAATTEFGSDAFLADLRFAAERAHELGLRFDLTLGSGWSFGGPHISTELAARQLHWVRREIGPEPLEVPVVSAWPGDELVAAYVGAGSLQEQPDSYERLPIVDGALVIGAGTAPRVVLLGYARLTGQNVKRAAVGAEGPVLDHYSAAATEAHLQAVGDPMLDAVPAELVGSVFCDSLEVYGSDWTPTLPAEFAAAEGLRPAGRPVPAYASMNPTQRGSVRTITAPWPSSTRRTSSPCVSAGRPDEACPSGFRATEHRRPESVATGSRTCSRVRGGAGGRSPRPDGPPRPRTCTAGPWSPLRSGPGCTRPPSAPSRWTSRARHTTTSSTASTSSSATAGPTRRPTQPGLGWFFYAAGALDDRNPWWPAMPELARYLGRLCWLLRQGEPTADIALYVPNEDLFAIMGRAQGGSLDTWREAHRRIPGAIPAAIRGAGFDYDLIDDDALAVTAPGRYRVVIVPTATEIPKATEAWLDDVRSSGGTVMAVESTCSLPGAIEVTADGLADALRDSGHVPIWRSRRRRRISGSSTVAAGTPTSISWPTPDRPLVPSPSPRGRTVGAMSNGMPCRGGCTAREPRRSRSN